MPFGRQPSFCGYGPSGSPERSVADWCPAAFPDVGIPSAAQWSFITDGRLLLNCCAWSGASISWIASPTSTCHSMWPVRATVPLVPDEN